MLNYFARTNVTSGYPSSLTLPATHQMAGCLVTVNNRLRNKFNGGHDKPLNRRLVGAAKGVSHFFGWSMDEGFVTAENIISALSYFPGEYLQVKAINELVKIVESGIEDVLRSFRSSIASQLYVTSPMNAGNNWEYSFQIDFGEVDEYRFVEDDFNGEARLLVNNTGLCNLFIDRHLVAEEFQIPLLQLISFCCRFCRHATSLDILQDPMLLYMATNAEFYNIQPCAVQTALAAYDNNGSFDSFKKDAGIEFEEDWVDEDRAIEVVRGFTEALILSSNFIPFSRRNVNRVCRSILSSGAPDWMKSASKVLLSADRSMYLESESMTFYGDFCRDYLSPVGFGLPCENDMYEMIHQMSMDGEEETGLSIKLDNTTLKELRRIEFGEVLLLFIESNLHELAI